MNRGTQVRDKAHFLERVSREMDEDLGVLDLSSAERMVLVGEDLKPRNGGRANPGVRFHVWIYRKRPISRCSSSARFPAATLDRARRLRLLGEAMPIAMKGPLSARSGDSASKLAG